MGTYTVKAGDTLSGIAQSLGLPNYSSLTGYASGNPGLIKPGEVLSYGGTAPVAPASSPTAIAPTPTTRLDPYGDALTSATTASNAAFQSLIDKQTAEQQGLFGQYTTAATGQEKLPALYSRLSAELGIPDLSSIAQGYKDQILTVQQLLGNLTSNVTERNRGTFTTEAQANRQIAAEGDPLRTDLANLGYALAPTEQALSGAQGTLGTLLNLNVQQQTKELHPLELQISAIGERFGREITGFTVQKQDTLNALMDKIQRGRQLSDAEWQNAQDLAKAETDFQRQKDLVAIQARNSVNSGLTLPSGLGSAGTTSTGATGKSIADWYSLGSGASTPSLGVSAVSPQGGGFSLQGGGIRLQ